MKKKLLIFLVISIAYILIFPYVKTNIIDKKYIFEIEATGEKNKKSNGTEVWIDSIEADGKEMNMSNLSLTTSWENRGRLYNPGTAGTLKVIIRGKNIQINFIQHPYSGIVKVKDPNGNVKKIDLYSDEQKSYSYHFEK